MSTANPVKTGYVITDTGTILVQTPSNNQWGFDLNDNEQTWPGGFGIAGSWELIAGDDPRITEEIRDELQWIIDEAELPEEDLTLGVMRVVKHDTSGEVFVVLMGFDGALEGVAGPVVKADVYDYENDRVKLDAIRHWHVETDDTEWLTGQPYTVIGSNYED